MTIRFKKVAYSDSIAISMPISYEGDWHVVGYMILFQVNCIGNNLLVLEHKKAEETMIS